MQRQVRFNRGLGGFGAEPRQVQQGSREGCSGEGLGGFGAEPRQVHQGSREGSGEGLGGLGAEPRQVQQGSGEGLGGFGAEPGQVQQSSRERSGQGCGEGLGGLALVQSRARFNEVPEKVPEKVLVESRAGSTRFRRRFWRRFRKGFGAARFNEASSRFRCDSGSLSVQLLGRVPANFGPKNCENKLLLLVGIPPKLIF